MAAAHPCCRHHFFQSAPNAARCRQTEPFAVVWLDTLLEKLLPVKIVLVIGNKINYDVRRPDK
jgi:hypothetical protein